MLRLRLRPIKAARKLEVALHWRSDALALTDNSAIALLKANSLDLSDLV